MATQTMTAANVADAMGDGGEVVTLLRDQAALYQKLERYARQQRLLVAEEEAGPLLALLAQRQKLSVEMTRIGARLAPARRDWNRIREQLTSAQRDEADRLIDEMGQRLHRVIESDERDARLLSTRKRMTADALRATHSTGQALSAYHSRAAHGVQALRLDEAS